MPAPATTPVPAGDLAKLPRWARNHVDILTDRLAAAERALDQASGGFRGTDTVVEPYRDHPLYLESGSAVRFYLSDGEYVDCEVTDPDVLGGDARLVVNGSRRLRVAMSAANVFYVQTY
jgi:hypothetical protein